MLYWKNQNHKIYCGDCLEEMKKLNSKSVNLIFTDPHYNINLGKYVKKYLKQCVDIETNPGRWKLYGAGLPSVVVSS